MTETLAYIAIIAAALLVILLLIGILGGDTDAGDGDLSMDGGFGIFKSVLTILAVGAWVLRYLILSGYNMSLAVLTALISGGVTAAILAYIFKLLLRNQKNVNWRTEEAIGKKAKVYLRILPGEAGLVTVEINGVERELPAKSNENTEIKTGEEVLIFDERDDILWVQSQR